MKISEAIFGRVDRNAETVETVTDKVIQEEIESDTDSNPPKGEPELDPVRDFFTNGTVFE